MTVAWKDVSQEKDSTSGCRGWGQGPWGWTGRLEALVEGGEGTEQVSGLVNPQGRVGVGGEAGQLCRGKSVYEDGIRVQERG